MKVLIQILMLQCFPSFVKFILRINNDEMETLPRVSKRKYIFERLIEMVSDVTFSA